MALENSLRNLERLGIFLQTQSPASTNQILTELKISRPTLSRLIQANSDQFIKVGKTNKTQYCLLQKIRGVEREIPVFRINAAGKLKEEAKLLPCYQQIFIYKPEETLLKGLPPEISDLIPQGFLGRSFAKQHASELKISDRPGDWQTESIMIALTKRGEDLPGNLIIGTESANRFLQLKNQSIEQKDYPELALQSLAGQTAGTSAGGEQPKFTGYSEHQHRLVKFGGSERSQAQSRVRDLLICEYHALQTLADHHISTAETNIILNKHWAFLESVRFDRIGEYGRKAVITLAAIDDYFFGKRDSWTEAADRFLKAKFISPTDARTIKLLDAFGMWIANTDRHFHNLSFFIDNISETRAELKLAPAFDQLPMLYMPIAGKVIKREFQAPSLTTSHLDVWDQAKAMALAFWVAVEKDKRISREFRKIAQQNRLVIN